MPVYVYRCNDCDYTFEARQRMTDNPLTECPSCDTGEVRRVINNVGVVFKGSGFYITDSRKKGSTTSTTSSTSSTTSSSSSSSSNGSKAEEKPAKKKESSS